MCGEMVTYVKSFFYAGFLSMGGELNEMVVKIKKKA